MVTSYFPPGVGGAPRLLEGYVRQFLSQGHTVEVVAFGGPLYPTAAAFDALQSYEIHRVPAAQMRSKEIIWMALRVIALALGRNLSRNKRYDLLFCGVAYPCALMAFAVNRMARIPYIVYCHGEDASIVRGFRRKEALLRRALLEASQVFANSEFTRGELAALGLPDSSAKLLPPSIDTARYLADNDAEVAGLRERIGLPGKRVLLTIARLTTPRKGHDTVVRCLPDLLGSFPDLSYVVVGNGDTSTLVNLAEELGVARNLTILPYVSEEDLPHLFRLAELYVMPSRYDPETQEVEGFGMVYIEAAASGRASIAGTSGGAADAVVDGVTGLCVNPDSIPSVAAAIRSLLADPELASKMGAAGRKRAVEEFSKEVLAASLNQVVDRAMSSGKIA